MGWKAPQLIDYSASLGCTSLFISDLDAFESLDDAALTTIRRQADGKGLQIHLGTWSVCPTSKAFKPNRGTADEHLALGIRAAKALGSPVIRVVLGTWEDRLTDGGINKHIESLLTVCRGQRSRAVDAGVKIAIENHAGDMHSTELARLVEAAGTDFVGVNFDSGNALWTLEDPLDALGNLGRYTVTTSLRDRRCGKPRPAPRWRGRRWAKGRSTWTPSSPDSINSARESPSTSRRSRASTARCRI